MDDSPTNRLSSIVHRHSHQEFIAIGYAVSMTQALIDVRDLGKTYKMGKMEVRALRHVTVTIDHGEFVAIMGPSGSGKSTFMNLIGCLDKPTAGTYFLDGIEVSRLNDNQLAEI